jgi:cytochrome b subunit of formate dehydrogenase
MVPGPKDAKHAVQNLLFFVGLRKERPNFPRFTYFEKFDYWAVFWGVLIMVGSGFVRWFPDLTVKYFPSWTYEIAHFAHADEAILAGLAIFVWHFYNVHLRPGIFPMSKVFLTGRLTMSELKHEHPAEYAEVMEKRAADGKQDKS